MSKTVSPPPLRTHLNADALYASIHARFKTFPDSRRDPTHSLPDTLMAGVALFALRDPSLLAFQSRRFDPNLHSVFGLHSVPSDSQMREILDDVPPSLLRLVFTDIFRLLQRGKVLEPYVFLEDSYLVALDGTEFFRSSCIHCPNCLRCTHSNGSVDFYHQLLSAVLIHPDCPEVFPLFPEFIQRHDGTAKNDCERNAASRWITAFRKDHPHLKVIIVEDGLSSNAPHIRDLLAAGLHFILVAKPKDHAHLFRQFAALVDADKVETLEEVDPETGIQRLYLFANGLQLNEANKEVLVNFVQVFEIDGEKETEWTWVTDIKVTRQNIREVARGGRARWKVENEKHNTLKNQGYHFEHNYGHGKKNLAGVMALLALVAFTVDQVQQRTNRTFRDAWRKSQTKRMLWEAIRGLFLVMTVTTMAEIYEAIAYGYVRPPLKKLIEQARTKANTTDTS